MFALFRVLENVAGKPGPARGIELSLVATAQKSGPAAYVLGIQGKLSFANRLISPHVVVMDAHWHGHDAALIQDGQDYTIRLFAPLTVEAIQFIEDKRRGVDDLQFSLELLVQAQEVEITPVPGARCVFRSIVNTRFGTS